MRESTDPVTLDAGALRSMPLPEAGDSKYSRGDVLVIGGSRSTPGAAMLAGVSALRAGAGRLTLALPESVALAMAVAVPEAAVVALPDVPPGGVPDLAPDLHDAVRVADAILIGPGLDDIDESVALLTSILPRVPEQVGVCLDAYAIAALRAIGGAPGRRFERLVLTPNKKEAADLHDGDIGDLGAAARDIAERHRATIACYDMIADETGRLWRGHPGSPGLGTSGSGDVLAGVVAGLLARGASSNEAAIWGAFAHATAGDRLAARTGPLGYLARELADEIPLAIAGIEQGGT